MAPGASRFASPSTSSFKPYRRRGSSSKHPRHNRHAVSPPSYVNGQPSYPATSAGSNSTPLARPRTSINGNGKARQSMVSVGTGVDDDEEEEGAIEDSDGEIEDEEKQEGQTSEPLQDPLPLDAAPTSAAPLRKASSSCTLFERLEQQSQQARPPSSSPPPPSAEAHSHRRRVGERINNIDAEGDAEVASQHRRSPRRDNEPSTSKLAKSPPPEHRSSSRVSPPPHDSRPRSRLSQSSRPLSPPLILPAHLRDHKDVSHRSASQRSSLPLKDDYKAVDSWIPADRPRRSPSPPNRPPLEHRRDERDRDRVRRHGEVWRGGRSRRDEQDDNERAIPSRSYSRSERRDGEERDSGRISRRSDRDEERRRFRSRSRSRSRDERDDDRRHRRYSRRDEQREEGWRSDRRRRSRSEDERRSERRERDEPARRARGTEAEYPERHTESMEVDKVKKPAYHDQLQRSQNIVAPPHPRTAEMERSVPPPRPDPKLEKEATISSKPTARPLDGSSITTASDSSAMPANINGTPQSPMTTPASTTSSSAKGGWKIIGDAATAAPPANAFVGIPTGPRSMRTAMSGPRSTTSGAIPTGPKAFQHGRKSSQSHSQPSTQLSSSPSMGPRATSPPMSLQQQWTPQPETPMQVEPADPSPTEPLPPGPPPPPPGPPPPRPAAVEPAAPPPLSFDHVLLPTELSLEQRKQGWRLSYDPELDSARSKGKKAIRKQADVKEAPPGGVGDPRRHKTATVARLAQSHRKKAKDLMTVVWEWDKNSTGPRPPPPPREIVVTGLSPLTTNRQLLDRFRLLGRIDKAELKMDPQTGQSMGIFWLRFAHDFDEDGNRLESTTAPGQKGNECATEAVRLANGERLGATDKMIILTDSQQTKYVEAFKKEMAKRAPVSASPKPPLASPNPAAVGGSASVHRLAAAATPLRSFPPTTSETAPQSSPLAASARSPSSSAATPRADIFRRREAQAQARSAMYPPQSQSQSQSQGQDGEDADMDSGEEFGNRHRLLASSSTRKGGFNQGGSIGTTGAGGGHRRSRLSSGDKRTDNELASRAPGDVDTGSNDVIEPTWTILSRLHHIGTPYVYVSRSTVGDGLSAALIHRHFAMFSPQSVSADELGWYAAFAGHDAAARCDKVLAGKPIYGFSASFEVRQAPRLEDVQAAKEIDAPRAGAASSSPSKLSSTNAAFSRRQPPDWLDPASALEWHKRQTFADRKATRGWTETELIEEARSTILRELADGFLKDLKTRLIVPHVSDFLKPDAEGGQALKKAAEQHAEDMAAMAKREAAAAAAAATSASTPTHAEGRTETALPSFRKIRRATPSPPPPRRPSQSQAGRKSADKSSLRKGGQALSDDERDDDDDEGERVQMTKRKPGQAASPHRRRSTAERVGDSGSSSESDESGDEHSLPIKSSSASAGIVRDATEETAETAETALTTPTPEPSPAAAAATATGKKKGGKKAAAAAKSAAKKKSSKKGSVVAAVIDEDGSAAPSPDAHVEDVVMEDAREPESEEAAMAKLTAAATVARSKKAKSSKSSSAAAARPRSPSPDPFVVGVAEEEEDLYFLKVALERLCAGESVTPSTLPEEIDQDEQGGEGHEEEGDGDTSLPSVLAPQQHVHDSGSARTEGFYKIPPAQKALHLPDRNKAIADTTTNVTLASARDNRADSRRVLLGIEQHKKDSHAGAGDDVGGEVTAVENHSDMLLKFNQLRSRKKQLKFAKSPIHDWGLYAMEPIPAGDMVIEYVGEQVRQQVADHRERLYEKSGNFSTYLFRVDDDVVVDATHKGNIARLMNHCCVPNCNARILTLNGQKRIVLYAKTTILPGQELTYDYKFQATPDAEDAIACLCGAEGCRRFL
ncbi:hypothetical protein BDZ90DRAFT_229297 [Jaminaea rosea]|uniref:Histone-lysine N-methyltransferase, H3 lysine-4 specific n=1 Tax=Jaminaea rosea TaxID=1569628 RepID=A0A316UY98_9BASI|nr:hypothetical protein BDZ90DRAFT_229297 [Jaminaea rosea]PWN30286.1 hypothetical protein BDZ90DRAFT_229297 [Jaminaea rosea]